MTIDNAAIVETLEEWKAPDPNTEDGKKEREAIAPEIWARLQALVTGGPSAPDSPKPDAALDRVLTALSQGGETAALAAIRAAMPPLPVEASDWQEPAPDREWVVPAWLPAGAVALFAGRGGIGKSRLALQLAYEVASGGRTWFAGGPQVEPRSSGKVVFASWEDDRHEIRRRLEQNPEIQQRLEDQKQDPDFAEDPESLKRTMLRNNLNRYLRNRLGNNLVFLDCAGCAPMWAPERGGSRHTSTMGALTDTGRAIRSTAERTKARLLIVDSLAAGFGCNENDRALVRAFMSDLNGWAARNGVAVLVIAHPPKQGKDAGPDAAWSGSTDWHNASRVVWTLERKTLNEMKGKKAADEEQPWPVLECVKSNYARRPGPVVLDEEPWTWWQANETAMEALQVDQAKTAARSQYEHDASELT